MSKRVLAFDFGASSGRAIIGEYTDGKISLKEVHRFTNDPVNIRGTLYWDALRLFHEIKQGILKANHDGGFDSIGIDTWGVDFGLLDKNGQLLENPVHYRDARTDNIMEEVFEVVPKEEIYERTGCQFASLNTIFQLFYLAKYRPEILERTDKMLLIPDLFAYFLTGEKTVEYTHASTTQLLNYKTKEWDFELIEKLGIPTHIFPEIVKPGASKGMISDDICEELGIKSVPVVAIGSHDTASAVLAVPTEKKDFIYVSCGTWSLFGTEADKPYINEKSIEYNITNEGGYGDKIRFLKNIMGLWLIQEARRQWIREGQDVSYADLEKDAMAEKGFVSFIDPDCEVFGKPGNMPRFVKEYCEKTGQHVPENRGQVMRTIYESLALKYRKAMEDVKDVTGKEYEVIHIVGGGTKDGLLCQMAADACNTKVVAGPIEATALGNVVAQLIASGDISDMWKAREIIKNSETMKCFTPKNPDEWDEAYKKYINIIM